MLQIREWNTGIFLLKHMHISGRARIKARLLDSRMRSVNMQHHQAFIRDINHLPLESVGGNKVKAFCFFPNKEHVGEHISLSLAGW